MNTRSGWSRRVAAVALAIAAACTSDNHVVSPVKDITAATTSPIPAEVLVGAGNVANCSTTNDDATAALLDNIAGTVFTTGDNTYGDGSLTDFQNCYNPSWGRHKARTRAAAGHKDYQQPGAAGFWKYFGAAAGDSGKYYYSYNLGAWHVVVLNSQIDMTLGSPQETWLKEDLAASTKLCTVALWDQPRFSSSGTSVRSAVKPLWDDLYAAKTDVVLNSHYRVYERFAPQNPAGAADPANGIRQFTVGTAGSTVDAFGAPIANSELRATNVFGVLKLTLGDGTYSWQFIAVAGQTFTDAGTGNCHRTGSTPAPPPPPPPPPPNQAPTANPGGPYTSTGTVTFDGSVSSDPDNNLPLTYAWAFGDGGTGTGVAPVHTFAGTGTFTVTLTVTDALGAASTPVTTTATIATGVNSAPVVNAGPDATVGVAFNISARFSDPDVGDAPWTYTIAWGDGAVDNGNTSAPANAIRATHTYASAGSYTVHVTVTDKNGGAGSDDARVTIANTNVLVGSADIADCGSSSGDEATANLLDGIPGTVFTAGDNAYPNGNAADYLNCYGPSWGRHLARTRPGVGNHDYHDDVSLGAADYFNYFGPAAGDPTTGWYSFDMGSWHIVALNSNLAMSAGSPQERWLRADLAASTKPCVLAYWHHPRFSSGSDHGSSTTPLPVWRALYEAGAEIVISGHDHDYERFAPQTPDGVADPSYGVREFVVGTGGKDHYAFGIPIANSEVRDNTSFGVLKLTLGDAGYEWQFIPVAGASFTDAGSGSCHGHPIAPPPPPPPAPPPPPPADAAILVGAGNVANCGAQNDEATAALLDNIAGTVFTTGDNIYGDGSITDFQNCYGPSWGRHKTRTRPAVGHKDYTAAEASGYAQYFGAAGGEAGKFYYSYDLGAWHVVVLNSQIDMSLGSPQEGWLKADLAASAKLCTLAIWDQPRFSSSGTTVRSAVKPLWDDLYAAKADVVLNAHYRVYERFAPQTPGGVADAVTGIRQFTVGTGGTAVDAFGTPLATSEVRATNVYGVLKLTLGDGTYSWQFIPISGQTFTDAGSGTCH